MMTNRGNRPNLFRQQRTHSAHSVNARLLTLVALMVIVLLAMREAGNPETWKRLGFDAPTQIPGAPAIDNAPAETDSSARDPIGPADNPPPIADPTPDAGTVLAFWQFQFQHITDDSLTRLDRFLRFHRTELPSSEFEPHEFDPLFKEFERGLSAYLDDHGDLSESQRSSLTASIKAVTEMENRRSDESRKAVEIIQHLFDQHVFAIVNDHASLGRSPERWAWRRCWELALQDQVPDQHIPVSYLQLTGQPDAYRGKKVRVAGAARGVQFIPLPDNHELDFGAYRVLWIKPNDGGRTPFCIYLRDLPENFPSATTTMKEIDEPVIVDGVFFKLRSYLATNGQVESTPLLVAKDVVWQMNQPVTDSSAQALPAWLIGLFFVGMPLIAAWLAYAVYRSTRSYPSRFNPRSDLSIGQSLIELANQTDSDQK